MTIKNTFFYSLLIIVSSCNGQETTTPVKAVNISKTSPVVIRNFKAVSVAPDFDTTMISQYIRSIFQDSKGSLWFGTLGEGLVRYNKKTLTYFSSPEGFISQSVYAINEDKQGNLWIGTDQGVYKYNGNAFRNYNQKDGLTQTDISRKSLLVDKAGSVWVGTHGGVFRYNPGADTTGGKSFSLFKELPLINVAGMMEDKRGNIWFASSDRGVFRYDPGLKDRKRITQFNEQEGLGENYAGGIAEDNDGNMWFTMKNGICKFDGKNFTEYTSKYCLGGTEFWGIIIEQSGIIWITARGSTTRFDPSIPLPNPNAFKVFTKKDGFTCCVQSMFQDKEGRMWWGTGQGVYRFNGTRFYQVRQKGPW